MEATWAWAVKNRTECSGGKVIYARYKGKDYKAWVVSNGGIRVKGVKGVVYDLVEITALGWQ